MSDTHLTPVDGREVISTAIVVRNAGDGLSQALAVDPRELHYGDTVYVVLETTVQEVHFKPVKDTDAFKRVHILRAGDATIVDAELVKAHVAEQRERISRHKEIEKGVARIEDAALIDAHDRQEHREAAVEYCPRCIDAKKARDRADRRAAKTATDDIETTAKPKSEKAPTTRSRAAAAKKAAKASRATKKSGSNVTPIGSRRSRAKK